MGFNIYEESSADGVASCQRQTLGEEGSTDDHAARPTLLSKGRLSVRAVEAQCEDFSSDFSHVRKVAIMGAGVAGLQTASRLSKAGFECVIFEKENDVGGIWRQNYADFGLQVPNSLYEFPEFPHPGTGEESWDLFPTGPQVQAYIQMYARKFKLLELVRFNTSILSISPLPAAKCSCQKRGWRVTSERRGEDQAEEDFDFVVVSNGMYGSPPHLPLAPGSAHFLKSGGQILHSCSFLDSELAAGKRVVVVGGGKSAVDNAVAAAKKSASCTLLYRDLHWPVPRYLANLVPFQWATYSRFGHAMLPTYYDETAESRWLHAVFAPLKWLWWRIVECLFCWQFALEPDQRPSHPIEHDLFTGGQILNYEYRDMLRKGRISGMKGSIQHFTEKGIVLSDGRQLECDMVIYGTGYGKSYSYLDDCSQAKLETQRDGVYLYRNMIPPGLRDLAFVGAEVSTFNNILTHGLQALWLERALTGKMKLPSASCMRRQVEKEQAWKRSWMPPSSVRSSIWQLHMVRYHDNLCQDMGESHLRKGWNKLAELFAPYTARDYAALFVRDEFQSSADSHSKGLTAKLLA
eukprot:TRINITY_DN6752_c0_g1_i2.p1 TRINITY_DN6752_c0_g1~~TRINITY_DN6752_c0_g1_i2.p1  ORF type:complete len:576 (+),score=81.59 TRINITY_DN6752_c0_g1_i2:50-1777(+)